jgi:hypothetical protein
MARRLSPLLALLAALVIPRAEADAAPRVTDDPCAVKKCVAIGARVRRRGDRVAVAGARVLLVAEPSRRKPG